MVAAGGVQAGALLLELALLRLALQLGVVRALRAGDPAAQQRDRVDLAVDLVSWFCIAIDGLSCPDAIRW